MSCLTDEQNRLVRDAEKIIRFMLAKGGITAANPDYDDVAQDARIRLVRASQLFDARRGIEWRTYAGRAIFTAASRWHERRQCMKRGGAGRGARGVALNVDIARCERWLAAPLPERTWESLDLSCLTETQLDALSRALRFGSIRTSAAAAGTSVATERMLRKGAVASLQARHG